MDNTGVFYTLNLCSTQGSSTKFKGENMIQQEDIDQFMQDIEKEDGNVIFIEDIYKEPEPVVPEFFSIIKYLFGWGK